MNQLGFIIHLMCPLHMTANISSSYIRDSNKAAQPIQSQSKRQVMTDWQTLLAGALVTISNLR